MSNKLFEELYEQGLRLITKLKKNMRKKLVPLLNKILLRKRAVIRANTSKLLLITIKVKNQRKNQHFSFGLV
ncbi:transposase [uncultured Nostoc sp.]|uniref:transposase n=1 Tax=uncultured Nostoc sp. TaxID=340711 RepID=UPI0035C9D6CB